MPTPISAAKAIAAVKSAPGTRVKVAVSDIDGVLRGKYLHKEKFYSAVEGGFGFCDVVFGWDMMDVTYDNTTLTGWHKGFPDVTGADRPRHAAHRALGRRRAVLPRRLRHPQGRQGGAAADLPAAGAEARAEARREARRHPDVRDGVRVVQLPRDAAILGGQAGRRADADHAGDVRLLAAARQREPRASSRRCSATWPRSACRSRGCTRRPARACTRRRSCSRRRWSRPTARSCSRPAPRKSARASASCRASWPSGTRTIRAARATCTPSLSDGKKNLFHDRKGTHGMSALFESFLAGPGRGAARVRADVLADDQQLQAPGRRLLGAGQADLGRRQPDRELSRRSPARPSRRGWRRAARAPTSTRTSRWRRCSRRASPASSRR